MDSQKIFHIGFIENIFLSKMTSRSFFWWIVFIFISQGIGVIVFVFWFKILKYPQTKIKDFLKIPNIHFSFENGYFRFPKKLLPEFFPSQISISQIQKVERKMCHLVFYTQYGTLEIPFFLGFSFENPKDLSTFKWTLIEDKASLDLIFEKNKILFKDKRKNMLWGVFFIVLFYYSIFFVFNFLSLNNFEIIKSMKVLEILLPVKDFLSSFLKN